MSATQPRISLLRSIIEIFGIALMRFRPVQRAWAIWLVAVNAASLLFISYTEAQIALGAVGAAVLMQALIYRRWRFVRILGATHILWLPMLAWMGARLATIPAEEPVFRGWLIALMATNALSLAIDAWDTLRFLQGERIPHYSW